MTILAIDQGTTSTRGLLAGPEGLRPAFSRRHAQIRPGPERVEHDPDELLRNVADAAEAGRQAGARLLALANQGESCLGWDAATGAPISPVLVWQDARTAPDLAALRHAQPEVTARAGLPLDPYFSASKLAWILQEVPEARALHRRGRLRLGTTDAFFRDRLTGRFETDPATASRTSLMSLATCAWDPALCEIFGVPMECLPAIRPCSGDLGEVGGLPLAASITDQQAALFGHGCRGAGDAKITFGTGAFALAVTGDAPPGAAGGALPTIAWQEGGGPVLYALDAGVYAASSAVDWAGGLGLFEGLEALNAFPHPDALSRGIAFVPALAGLACPHWDRGARGAWLGLSLADGKADLMQAVLEGVAYRTAEALDAIAAETPLRGAISVDGGMSANPWFMQRMADIAGRPLLVSAEAERTALGAAALAARAAGEAEPNAPEGRALRPDPGAPVLRERFAEARRLAQAWGEGGS